MNQFHLSPKPPYDFNLSAAIFSGGDPAIRNYENGMYHHTLEMKGYPFHIGLHSEGTPGKPLLVFSVSPDPRHHGVETESITSLIESMFNIHDDLIPFYHDVRADEIMTRLVLQLNGLKAPTTPTVFEALVDSVIEQQISLSVARILQNRLIRSLGKKLVLNSLVHYCYPTPEILEQAPPELFRECGMTARKGEYIRGISRAVVLGDLDLEHFRSYPDTDRIIEEMTNIRGIGKWTAELAILRGVHKLDAFPADDVALRRIMGRYYSAGKKISVSEALEIAARWGRWKGLAAFYLEIADHFKLKV